MGNINKLMFREYDIRGLVDQEIDEEVANLFGKAFGTYLLEKGTSQVICGHDARKSSPAFYASCIEGLVSTGVNVIKMGMVTSPMMYWARRFYQIDGGLIITASHNPPQYNGFKPASGDGALFGEEIQKILQIILDGNFKTGNGQISEKVITDDYFDDIKSRLKFSKKLSIIVDCGNATAGPFAPELLSQLGLDVEKLFCDIDPAFPNHPPDPVDPKAYPAIVEKIKRGKYDLGLLFDGDADRLGVVDHEGNIVRGDQLTALCAREILERKKSGKILFELQCSKSATDDVVNHGGEVILTRVGHSFIEDALHKQKGELAGETSGHIFFADRWYGFDDAIYAACRILEYLSKTSESMKQLVDSMPKYFATPITRISASDEKKFEIIENLKTHFKSQGYQINEIDGVRLEWDDGWAVVRASNTQPQLTLRAEASSEKRLDEIKNTLETSLLPYEMKVVWGQI